MPIEYICLWQKLDNPIWQLKYKLPEAVDVSLLTPVDVFSSALVAKVEIFVSVKAVVLLADPVAVDMLGVWLGVVTLELVIVNAESVVLGTDGIRSDALLVVL